MLFSLNRLFRGRSKKLGTRPGVRPRLEALENREVLTAGITFDAPTGVIRIEGSNVADVATASLDIGSIFTMDDDQIVVSLTSNGQTQTARFDRYWASPFGHMDRVSRVAFYGLDGDDRFTSTSAVPTTAYGFDGNATLAGGHGDDALFGGSGNDIIRGGVGDDQVQGGTGDDTLLGEAGDDEVTGGGGRNSIWGGDGNDELTGGDERDTIWGGD